MWIKFTVESSFFWCFPWVSYLKMLAFLDDESKTECLCEPMGSWWLRVFPFPLAHGDVCSSQEYLSSKYKQPNYLSSLPSLFTLAGLMRSSLFHTKHAFLWSMPFTTRISCVLRGNHYFFHTFQQLNHAQLFCFVICREGFLVIPVRCHHWGILEVSCFLCFGQRNLKGLPRRRGL